MAPGPDLATAHEAVAARVPGRDCIVWRDRRLSWAQVTDRTRRLARWLGPGRVPTGGARWECPNRRVALYLTNGNEYLEGMLGAAKASWSAVNVNYRYVAEELAYVLTDSAAEAVVFHGRFAATLADALPADRAAWPRLLQVDDGTGADLLPGAVAYEAALADQAPGVPPWWADAPPDGEDRYVLYTGGTTGQPKGVLWRQADFLATCLGVHGTVEDLADAAARSGLRVLASPPFMHGAAHWNAISAWLAGGTVVIQDHPDRLDAADLLDTCARHDVSSILLVGDAFGRPLVEELRAHPRHLPGLRFLLSGGAILTPTVKAELLALLPDARIVDILGSSETGRQGVQTTAVGGPAGARFAPGSTTVVLSADRTHGLAPGTDEIGWLAQRGRVPLGYLGDPVRTAATFPEVDGERLAVAGDRARLGADGSIELLGRDSATINTGGEKVFAEEVEAALKRHPAVFDALVVGVPDPRWGQVVAAVVALRPGHEDPGAEALRAVAGEHLARYKLPRRVEVRPAVQRSPSGKPDYVWARAQLA